jgi:hypothetical protein
MEGLIRLKKGAHQQQTLLTREVQRLTAEVFTFEGKTAPPFCSKKTPDHTLSIPKMFAVLQERLFYAMIAPAIF